MEKVTKCRFDPAERRVYEVLDALNIRYIRFEHPPVFTVEEAREHWKDVPGVHCKNLFLRNYKGNRHFLVVLEASKRADLKALSLKLGTDRVSFGSDERLRRCLGLTPGSVSPFGLINDAKKEVEVVLDEDLKQADSVCFHPNVNTSTLNLSYADFERFLGWTGHSFRFLNI
ncbi:MAG: prolyl-tRNA synthetase associated domain-containing protein [Candidatus Aminicenantes bacterium]|nr:prolyl-tRNA synthetase associated domain-containing protein [Candidatus Aminicenantes bacterium]